MTTTTLYGTAKRYITGYDISDRLVSIPAGTAVRVTETRHGKFIVKTAALQIETDQPGEFVTGFKSPRMNWADMIARVDPA